MGASGLLPGYHVTAMVGDKAGTQSPNPAAQDHVGATFPLTGEGGSTSPKISLLLALPRHGMARATQRDYRHVRGPRWPQG